MSSLVSATTTELFGDSLKRATESTLMSSCGFVPVQLYLRMLSLKFYIIFII